ncbi:MAG TPA: short-chain dehydrogenase/reductase SDR, partial [Ktedonobacter sp.]|nr:short-chain dehydrogenase/reductase SDR [Ktedonobacter sp.]
MTDFSNKAVLVTGAGSGIGYALCKAFADAGAAVALNDINTELCQQAAQRINNDLGVERVHAYAGDVADVETIKAIIHQFAEMTGRLDVVIANAGLTNYGAFLTYTPEA